MDGSPGIRQEFDVSALVALAKKRFPAVAFTVEGQ